MYRVYSSEGNRIGDPTHDLQWAKRLADNDGAGAKVNRYSQKDPSREKTVYISDVDRPTDHIWMNMEDVVRVLDHFLADNGIAWEDRNAPEVQAMFRSRLFGFNLMAAHSMTIHKGR